jgi:hypothetical protein
MTCSLPDICVACKEEKVMSDFITRMKAEGDELLDRLTKLYAFLDSPTYNGLSGHQQMLLTMQCEYMSGYARILERRIDIEYENGKEIVR